MSWLNQERDRLKDEIKRLEKTEKRLKKQAALLEKKMTEPFQPEEKEITREAKFKLEPHHQDTINTYARKRRLRVHHKKARNRFFFMLAVLLILGLILWRILS
ncbi:MAG: hypothetical protein AAF558_12125 [Verrucomicrobiota bacterium]